MFTLTHTLTHDSLRWWFSTEGDCVPPGSLGTIWRRLVVMSGQCYRHLVGGGQQRCSKAHNTLDGPHHG